MTTRRRHARGAAVLASAGALVVLAVAASPARADTLSFSFDDARVSLGPLEAVQIVPPGADPATFTASYDPATGSFTAPGSALVLPSVTLEDIDASPAGLPLTVDVKAGLTATGTIAGTFDRSSGQLQFQTLNVRASVGVYPSNFPIALLSCAITPIPVPLASAGSLGAYDGSAFTPQGAAAATWSSLPPATGGEFCSAADAVLDGPGGVWLAGTVSAPAAGAGGPGGQQGVAAVHRACKKAKHAKKRRARRCAKKKKKKKRS